MAFSEEVKQAALRRAGYQCECTRIACNVHREYRCPTRLVDGRWHAHHKLADSKGGKDTLDNCQALCIPCHKETPSYGVS
jgi:5-methylcytosine-specific restriction endonuclease McrA